MRPTKSRFSLFGFLTGQRAGDAARKPAVDAAAHQEAQARMEAKRQQILQTMSNDINALIDSQIEVRHVMTSRLRTVLPTTNVANVVAEIRRLETRHMLVCSEEGKLLGIVSDRDLRGTKKKTAAEVMTLNPLTVTSCSMLKPAVTLMLDKHISSLAVVDEGKLLGIITMTDLVMALQCAMQVLRQLAGKKSADLVAVSNVAGTELAACG